MQFPLLSCLQAPPQQARKYTHMNTNDVSLPAWLCLIPFPCSHLGKTRLSSRKGGRCPSPRPCAAMLLLDPFSLQPPGKTSLSLSRNCGRCPLTTTCLTMLHLLLMQPPWDDKLEFAPGRPFFINHYTYGMDYTKEGEQLLLSSSQMARQPACRAMHRLTLPHAAPAGSNV